MPIAEADYMVRLTDACKRAYIGDGARDLAELIGEIRDVPGDIAEFGSYRGGSAMVMALAADYYAPPVRQVWAHDTFEGMPEVSEEDVHKKGDFTPDFNDVMNAVNDIPNIVLVRGDICKTVSPAPVFSKLALTFFDCDLYEPHKVALPIVWERTSPGGWILFDDYGCHDCPGTRKAVDEFVESKGIELGSYQAWRAIQKCTA